MAKTKTKAKKDVPSVLVVRAPRIPQSSNKDRVVFRRDGVELVIGNRDALAKIPLRSHLKLLKADI